MQRTFIELPEFLKDGKELGLGEDELFDLETYLLKNPDAAPVVRGELEAYENLDGRQRGRASLAAPA